MSTDLAMRSDDALYAFVQNAQAVMPIAQALSNTSFVPGMMRGKPAEICAAIMTGDELGIPPMAALRSIDIIDGNPTLRAIAMRGLVQSKGHEVWVQESTATRAIVAGQRRGSDHIQTSEWTIERADQAGLVKKKNWLANPTAMLIARATSEVCRLIASDLLLATPYSSEEIRDSTPDPEPDAPEPTVTFRREAPQPVDEPAPVPGDWPEVTE